MAFAANYPHTGSQIGGDSQGRNRIRTSLSTNIIIQVNGSPIGAIQTLSYNETRPIKMIDEVGTDGHVDGVPNQSTSIKGDCTRIKFDNLSIAAAFSRGFVHASAQRIPFDIHIIDIFSANENDASGFEADDATVITVLKKVWIASISRDFKTSEFAISERMSFEAQTVYSFMNNGNSAVPAVGARILAGTDIDAFEQQADTGLRLGALDAAGLINAVQGLGG
jgi:hypothetical protein